MTVGIVLVSHSRALAEASLALAEVMLSDERPHVAIAAGMPDGRFGTDATAVMSAIEQVSSGDGVAVFADLGSALMSAETAIDLLGAGDDVRIVAAPFVEGLTAGLIRAAMGASLDEVVEAAESSMDAKLSALGRLPQHYAGEQRGGTEVRLVNAIGLHARPAARLAALASKYDAEITVSFSGRAPVNAKSTMSLMALGAKLGDTILVDAEGPQADEALDAVVSFIAQGLGDPPA